MKKLIISILGIAIVLVVFYVIMKPTAIAPNGELASPTPTTTSELNVTVISPTAGQTVSSPIAVNGLERTFEQNVAWRLLDKDGNQVESGFTTGNAPDLGIFGPYSFTITTDIKGSAEIWVFEYSAKDGEIINLVKVPVVIK